MKKRFAGLSDSRRGPITILTPIILAALLACVGCTRQHLMKTPVIVAAGGVDPFAKVGPENRTQSFPVLVVSGRTPSGSATPGKFYTGQRSRTLRLGVATMTIGPGLNWAELVEQSKAERRDEDPEIRFDAYREYGILWSSIPPTMMAEDAAEPDRAPAADFVAAIEQMLDKSRRNEITIYVHGFNTKFDLNLGIAAEFWHYMGRDGAMISFDWPSEASLFAYQADKANAAYSTRQFRTLLEFLAENTSATRINILAHSAGGPVVMESLRDLSLMNRDKSEAELRAACRIGRVVLAAPDMDLLSALNAGFDGAGRVPESFSIYASTADKALLLSSAIFRADRLGSSVNRLTPDERAALRRAPTQAIDVTSAEERSGTFLGHSYYHQNPWVSSDVALSLAFSASPTERGLVRDEKSAFWTFPDTYGDNIVDVARALLARSARAQSDPHHHRPESASAAHDTNADRVGAMEALQ